ncbi:ATP-binding protein [Streptomyces sp. B3I8]|uniref:sensor histidine kinase n=1 Tax=Streptomyces sp. B3I8 TaxID=3042303 RepID=UPI00277EEB20|nr:sensor histidine kinase [Streptomyces sp. B3I8]MDQ0785129.1 signal transduction histidine kinase [Streptomyces sp. B3I8]
MRDKQAADAGVVASGWTTRRWLRVGVGATLAVLAVLGGLGTWSMSRASDLTGQVVDTDSPALISAVRLEAALVNQETGVRGYGLAGQRDFLAPYNEGVTDEKDALRRLRPLIRDDASARKDLAEVERLAGQWQRRIARPVAAAPAGAAVPLATERADEGKQTFDSLRSAMKRQQAHLQDTRAAADDDLARATTLRNWVFTAIALSILAVAVLVFEGLRRGVTAPLTRIAASAREVAEGGFDRPIAAEGPADLRRLGMDVEEMRRRLVEELAQAESSRRQLDEQAADLRRSNAELEQFAYVASHDLQEPLRKVSSFTQLLQRRYGEQLDARADQYIAFAVDGANRMQVLINDLLAFSRVGRVHNESREVDLEALVESTVATLSMAAEETGAEITHDALPTVVGDTTQLGMLWQNLLSNALKFHSPERPPRIHIEARQDGDTWHFAVRDNGIGIAPEFRDKVFVIFQRLHTKDAYPGTGIGLAMCKKVVEFHGGTIGIDPEYAPGTRVVFTLPVLRAAVPATTEEPTA